MAFDIGWKEGLAVRLPDQQAQIRANANLQRQAKIAQEAKAKMFADDFEYNNAMNAHDNPLVKDFASKKLMEIGGYLRSNPDWETNPMKRVQYKTMLHELKDNSDLNRGLQSDANFAEAQKWLVNPKNAKLANNPKVAQKIKKEQANYLKFGNQLGEQGATQFGKKSYTFIAPEDTIDTTERLRKFATDITPKLRQAVKRPGFIGAEKYVVSDDDKLNFANSVLNDDFATAFENEWEMVPENVKSQYQGDIKKWIIDRAAPYFKETNVAGQQPNQDSGDGLTANYSVTPQQNKVINLNVQNKGGGVSTGGTTTARRSWELKSNIPIQKEVQQVVNPQTWEIEYPVGGEQFTTSSVIELPVLKDGEQKGKPVRTSVALQYPGSVEWKKFASGTITRDVATGDVDGHGQAQTKREAVPYYVDYDIMKPVLKQRKINLIGEEEQIDEPVYTAPKQPKAKDPLGLGL